MNALHRSLLAAAVAVGSVLALAPAARAQVTDSTTVKPQLNTAPPSAPPRQTLPTTPQPAVPVPAPTPAPVYTPQAPQQPSYNSPSGLELPNRVGVAAPPPPVRKYFLYTNFGLGYSSDAYYGGQFSVSLSPALGYRVSEKFSVGPGISYTYNNISFPDAYQAAGLSSNLNLNSIGLKGFAQYNIFDQFLLHAEYEVTRAQSYDIYQLPSRQLQVIKTNRNLSTLLGGVGYRNQVSERAALDILLLYNFNNGYDSQGYPTSPYGQPVVRFCFLYDLK